MINAAITIMILLALGTGIILLQIFLSRKENKWPGLILPVISFCVSLVAVLSVAAFTTITATGELQVTDENGVILQEEAISAASVAPDIPALLFTATGVFLLYNIPTAVLLAIYFACREKHRRRKALGKMQAQDLE